MASELVLRIEMGTPTIGIWCDDCSLPAAVSVPINNLRDDGITQIGKLDRCLNCKPLGRQR